MKIFKEVWGKQKKKISNEPFEIRLSKPKETKLKMEASPLRKNSEKPK